MHAIIKHGAAFADALEVCEQFDARKVAAGALITEQSTLDALKNGGGLTRVSAVTKTDNEKDWDGLTPEQEKAAQDKAQAERQQALAEYERELGEIRERADKLDRELDDWERDLRKRQAEADANDIVLRDGRRVLVGQKGELVDKASGETLEGADEAEAERKKKVDSTTVEKDKELRNEWAAYGEAKDHARKAKDLASQDAKNLSPEEIAQAGREQTEAEEITKRRRRLETSGDNGPLLSNKDTLAALGLGPQESVRTTSFAATLDEKDSRAIGLQDQFTGAAQAPDAPPPPTPANNQAPAGTTPKQISQANQ